MVAAHATQGGSDGKGQNGREAMPSALGSTRIRDGGKERGEGLHLLSVQFHVNTSSLIGSRKEGLAEKGLRMGV